MAFPLPPRLDPHPPPPRLLSPHPPALPDCPAGQSPRGVTRAFGAVSADEVIPVATPGPLVGLRHGGPWFRRDGPAGDGRRCRPRPWACDVAVSARRAWGRWAGSESRWWYAHQVTHTSFAYRGAAAAGYAPAATTGQNKRSRGNRSGRRVPPDAALALMILPQRNSTKTKKGWWEPVNTRRRIGPASKGFGRPRACL